MEILEAGYLSRGRRTNGAFTYYMSEMSIDKLFGVKAKTTQGARIRLCS
jgi:hypothetical protein